jgi:hypothetical protein
LAEIIARFQQAGSHPPSSELQGASAATFVVPASGDALILLRGPAAKQLSQNFGQGLTIKGDSCEGAFELSCPSFYVRAVSPHRREPAWAIAIPANAPATITYGQQRPVATVRAIINNFDFKYGNDEALHPGQPRREAIHVEAASRAVVFAWMEDYEERKLLVEAGLLRTTALTTFTFDAWDGASEEDLRAFANNMASLCGVVAQQHTGVPVLSFLDGTGHVVKRIVVNPLESAFRPRCIIAAPHLEDGLPQLFRDCFAEHVRMQGSDLWKRLPFFCAAIEDPPYLEQKLATLMAAVEHLIRSSLVEAGHCTAEESEDLTLPQLIGAARSKLRWTLPKHYTAQERHRRLRNAVAHGGPLPGRIEGVRGAFDKWHLFLNRRLLLRLGYNGAVSSPHQGFASLSAVDDFTEEHNAFGI